MRPMSGLWIAVGGGVLAQKIAWAIETRWEFSYPVPEAEIKPRRAEVVIVSLYGTTPDYLGLSQLGRSVATGQVTLMISNLVPVRRMDRIAVRAALPKKFSGRYIPPAIGVDRPTPRLWEEIQKVLIEHTVEVDTRLDDLRRALREADQRPRGRISGGLEIFERDAIASALQAWGGTAIRKRVMRSAISPSDATAPFLSRLRNVPLREDPQISHDHSTFPGMTVAERDIVGSIVLTDGPDRLTILNCNRQPLEQTLGVDLIYYNHRFKSFILVQYKRMTEKNGILRYRPAQDPSHEKEMSRMRAAEALLQTISIAGSSDTSAYRLSTKPFFIKLCETKAKAALDSGMVSGMYVPLNLWRKLLKSPAVRGPKGGVRITWENCTRRFSNAEFTNLLRYGWIGSTAEHSEKLSEIIEADLGSGRMLVLAATAPGSGSRDFRRDNLGRFTDEDDPEGSS
jgi:hypothetical protein